MTTPAALSQESQRAFPPHARPDRYFPASVIEAARQRLDACVRRGDGPALVVGPSGMGKTMLLEVLAASLGDRFRAVALTASQLCTRRALLQAILYGLDLPYRDQEEGELRLALTQTLTDGLTHPGGMLLLVDEAQSLSVKLLEELRVLSNLSRRGVPLVRLVLFGGPGLEDTFAAPELETFNQRLAARCYLSAMSYEETRNYVRSHVAAVGADPDEVFTPDGLDAVFHASDGVPRLVSQVCDRALVTAVAHSRPSVDNGVMQLAWSDLHQLPAPWNTEEPEAAWVEAPSPTMAYAEVSPEVGVVEFDPLADPLEEAAQAPRSPQWNADEALLDLQAEEPAEEPTPAAREVADPFGEDFAEEEVVIDRFTSLDRVFRPSTPVVKNAQDPTLGATVRTFDLAEPEDSFNAPEAANDEELAELELEDLEEVLGLEPDSAESLDETSIAPAPLRLQATDDRLEEMHEETGEDASDEANQEGYYDYFADSEYRQGSPATTLRFGDTELEEPEESDILVIENDLVEIGGRAVPSVRRREYRKLFAQLRRG